MSDSILINLESSGK